jgi:hypothetical protein
MKSMYDEDPTKTIRLQTNRYCVDIRFDGTLDGMLKLSRDGYADLITAFRTLADMTFPEETARRWEQRIAELKAQFAAAKKAESPL